MFIVKNTDISPFVLQDDHVYLEIQAGESVDLEAIFSHEQLYYSSLSPTGGLWLAIISSNLVRRDDTDISDVPIATAFYDAVWRYAPDQGQKEALVGTVPIPSSTNRYVTEADFGIASSVETTDNIPKVLYEVTIPTNSIALVQTWVTAARITGNGSAGDAGCFVRLATIKNVNDVLSLKVVESVYTYRDQALWHISIDTNLTKARVLVQGSLNTTILWSGKTRHQIQLL